MAALNQFISTVIGKYSYCRGYTVIDIPWQGVSGEPKLRGASYQATDTEIQNIKKDLGLW